MFQHLARCILKSSCTGSILAVRCLIAFAPSPRCRHLRAAADPNLKMPCLGYRSYDVVGPISSPSRMKYYCRVQSRRRCKQQDGGKLGVATYQSYPQHALTFVTTHTPVPFLHLTEVSPGTGWLLSISRLGRTVAASKLLHS